MDLPLRPLLLASIHRLGWRVWAGLGLGRPVRVATGRRAELVHPGVAPAVEEALEDHIGWLLARGPVEGADLDRILPAFRPGSPAWQTLGVVGALLDAGRESRAERLVAALRGAGGSRGAGRRANLAEKALRTGRCGDGPQGWIATTPARAALLPGGLDLVAELVRRGEEAAARRVLSRVSRRQRWRAEALVAGVFGDDGERAGLPHPRARDQAWGLAALWSAEEASAEALLGAVQSGAVVSEVAVLRAWRPLEWGHGRAALAASLARWLPRVDRQRHGPARVRLALVRDLLETSDTRSFHHHWVRVQGRVHVPAWRRPPHHLSSPGHHALLDWMLAGGFGLLRRHVAQPGLRRALGAALPPDDLSALFAAAALADGGHQLRDPLLAELVRGPERWVPAGTDHPVLADPSGAAGLEDGALWGALAITALRGQAPRGLAWRLRRLVALGERDRGAALAPVRRHLRRAGALPTLAWLEQQDRRAVGWRPSHPGVRPVAEQTGLSELVTVLGLPARCLGVLRAGRPWPVALGHAPVQGAPGGLQLHWLTGWRGRWHLGPTALELASADRGALMQLVLDRAGVVVRVDGPATGPSRRFGRPPRDPLAVVGGCLALREPDGVPVAVLSAFGARPVPDGALLSVAQELLQLGAVEVGLPPERGLGTAGGEGARVRRLSTQRAPVDHPLLPSPQRTVGAERWRWLRS